MGRPRPAVSPPAPRSAPKYQHRACADALTAALVPVPVPVTRTRTRTRTHPQNPHRPRPMGACRAPGQRCTAAQVRLARRPARRRGGRHEPNPLCMHSPSWSPWAARRTCVLLVRGADKQPGHLGSPSGTSPETFASRVHDPFASTARPPLWSTGRPRFSFYCSAPHKDGSPKLTRCTCRCRPGSEAPQPSTHRGPEQRPHSACAPPSASSSS